MQKIFGNGHTQKGSSSILLSHPALNSTRRCIATPPSCRIPTAVSDSPNWQPASVGWYDHGQDTVVGYVYAERRWVSLSRFSFRPATPLSAVDRRCSFPNRPPNQPPDACSSSKPDTDSGAAMTCPKFEGLASLYNMALKLTGRPVTALAFVAGRPGTGPGVARAAPGHPAAYRQRYTHSL